MTVSIGSEVSRIRDLRTLYKDDDHLLCRGRYIIDEVERSVLALMTSERPAPHVSEQLAHAYSLRDYLDASCTARPLALLNDQGRATLLMEDPGGALLSDVVDGPMEIGLFLHLASGLASTLHKVHEKGLIHKDIKPANILADLETAKAWLIGFGIATRLPRERQAPTAPSLIAGTFAYMAPEQTGHMNRSIDSRSDLYALGVTFYEMLTGTLPFQASDPMEWIHCHVAREPSPLPRGPNNIPQPVSSIVMKLIRKTPEERYQTAAGIEYDLQRCLREWNSSGSITPFELGERDVARRLSMPEKLYGRDDQIRVLVSALRRVASQGNSELVLVSGSSGVGKSSIVNELYRILASSQGRFAAGKFDQYRRDVPYAALAQAFQPLILQILRASDNELADWRAKLIAALGAHGQVIVGLVPELAFVIGEQPFIPELSGPEAQSRFYLAIKHFLGVFAEPNRPLVLFFDDLQWLDAATLETFERLASDTDLRHVLLVGAYRDNEVGAAHPLTRRLEAIHSTGLPVHHIALFPIGRTEIASMIADALHMNLAAVSSIANLVTDKTGGNPFFAIQAVCALVDEGLLAYDPVAAHWSWDIDHIRSRKVSDSVVDLLVERLSRLPAATMRILKVLACLGAATVDARSLAKLVQQNKSEVRDDLREAVHAGLVLQIGDTFAFAHDRITEAVYARLTGSEREGIHRELAFRILGRFDERMIEDKIFEVAGQFNRSGLEHFEPNERSTAAELNLRAGRKARSSAAYLPACNYMAKGLELLGAERWADHQDLAYALTLEQAECTFLAGNLPHAKKLIDELLQHAATNIQRAAVYRLKIEMHVVRSEHEMAVDSTLHALRLFGIKFEAHPDPKEVRLEYDSIWQNLGDHPIEGVAYLPTMKNLEMQAVMRILAEAWPPAYFTDFNLVTLIICRMVNISLIYGIADPSNQGLALLGWLMGPAFGRYEEGYRIALLACDFATRRSTIDASRTMDTMGLTASWTKPLSEAIDWWRKAYRTGVKNGDIFFACYPSAQAACYLLLQGQHLAQAMAEAKEYLSSAERLSFSFGIDLIRTTERTMACLMGETRGLTEFSDDTFDENELLSRVQSTSGSSVFVYWYWTRKTMLHYLAGDYHQALNAASMVNPGSRARIVHVQHLDYHYYSALALTALLEEMPSQESDELWARLRGHRDQLRAWHTQTNSPTFADKSLLVEAEIARLEGRDVEAMQLYERAIAEARQHGFLNYQAVAHELAARHQSRLNLKTSEIEHLKQARDCYLSWGARAKVHQLEKVYPILQTDAASLTSRRTIVAAFDQLDLASVIKVSQSLSSELSLNGLIDTIMRIALEHAGAERAVLIIMEESEPRVVAQAITTGTDVSVTLDNAKLIDGIIPVSIIRYVLRTQDLVILQDASSQGGFQDDPAVRARGAKSLMCLPLLNQGKLLGILHLENGLSARTFTPDRVTMLKLIASQAAISLENTRLYRDLERRDAKIRRLFDGNILGMFVWHLDGRITEANDAFLHMLDLPRAELEAGLLNWAALTPANWHDLDAARAAQIEATGRLPVFEKEFLRRDGTPIPVLVGGATFGEPHDHGIAFVLNLTERKEAEKSLNAARADLAHLERVTTVGHLTASIGHEINQPVAATATDAQAAVRWLSNTPPNVEEALEAMQRIIGNAFRISEVISRIRALIKKAPERHEPFQVNEAIRDLVGLITPKVMRHHAVLSVELDPTLPMTRGDVVQIQQVLMNLIVNAVEAMAEVDGPRQVVVRTSTKRDSEIQVVVQDTGPGLPPGAPEDVFEAFSTTKREGLGIGLAICKSIVEAHGGRISAQRIKPQGAIFEFTLPADRDAFKSQHE